MILHGETELVPPTNLTPHPRNARRGDVAAIASSIRQHGFYGRVIAQRSTGHVLVGNHRLRAAIEAGLPEIPVEWIDVDDDRALRILLADNRASDLATYESTELAALLEELSATALELEGTLYSVDAIDELLESLKPDAEGAAGGGAYTQKVTTPIYEPTGPALPPLELRDRTRADELRAEIETADLEPDLRAFLLDAAERHVAFRFDRIANFYANATAPVQRLMERSALVIVDFDQAIELGFVRLAEEVDAAFAEDYPDA